MNYLFLLAVNKWIFIYLSLLLSIVVYARLIIF